MLIQKFSRLLLSLILFISAPAWAWDSVGHRLISTIAYDQLTPVAKAKVDELTLLLDPGYPPLQRFLYISTLPDQWRKEDPKTAGWHFYNGGWSPDNTPLQPAKSPNLQSVIPQLSAEIKLQHNKAQAKSLAYLVHLVEDAHQPLHCSNRFSKESPRGDAGGNLFPLRDKNADNLHTYWDRAARLLATGQHYPLRNKQILKLAKIIEAEYPPEDFVSQRKPESIQAWMTECLDVARSVYDVSPNRRPGKVYRARVAEISSRQFALAGYRLADLINALFSKEKMTQVK